MLDIAACFLVLTAALAYLNHRFVHLPMTIGVMATSLAATLALVALDALGVAHGLRAAEQALIASIDFSTVLMQGMLSLLLFAGALHLDLGDLRAYRWQVGVLAVIGTALSTVIVGVAIWALLPFIGLPLPLLHCLLFGALISPTDPIAVIGMLKAAGAPRNLEVVIAGESLFNDGIGVVIFSLLLEMLVGGATPDLWRGSVLLLQEAGGGLLFGFVLGGITFYLVRSIDQYQLEVMITLAAVLGGYALANHLHVSGPLAMVVTGLMVGNAGRAHAMSDRTRQHMDMFWELLDEMLNAVLFVLIGMQVIVIRQPADHGVAAAASIAAVVVTLGARWLTVGLPVLVLPRLFSLPRGSALVLTWGGLRGGISVALALSLPVAASRETLIAMTYSVVVFSILGQGLTFKRTVRAAIDG
jgi:CPA1 family monovalent cation:H+ antiporter